MKESNFGNVLNQGVLEVVERLGHLNTIFSILKYILNLVGESQNVLNPESNTD